MKSDSIHSPTCPDTIGESDLERFKRDGYLAFERLLSNAEVDAGRAAIRELIERAYERKQVTVMGDINVGAHDLPGQQQFYVQYEAGSDLAQIPFDACEDRVRKSMWLVNEHPFFRYLAYEHPKIRMLLSSLLHPNAVLFQEMMLIKPAFIGAARDWHQDDAYFAVKPLDAVLGMWLGFDDATPENGCMHVQPGGHTRGPLLQNSSVNCTISSPTGWTSTKWCLCRCRPAAQCSCPDWSRI